MNKYKNKLIKLFQENDVVLAYLFGSYAKTDIGPLSDIDTAVLLSEDVERKGMLNTKRREDKKNERHNGIAQKSRYGNKGD